MLVVYMDISELTTTPIHPENMSLGDVRYKK